MTRVSKREQCIYYSAVKSETKYYMSGTIVWRGKVVQQQGIWDISFCHRMGNRLPSKL